jgi:hypothetical protein
VFGGRCAEGVSDLGVDVVERVGGVVEVVERCGVGYQVGRRVDRGAQVAVRRPFDRSQGVDGDVVVAAGAEADDDDARSPLRVHRQPSATTWPVVASKVP